MRRVPARSIAEHVYLGLPALAFLATAGVLSLCPTLFAAGAEGVPDAAANTLTREEASAGWRLLFDGKTFDGWRGFRQDGVPSGWRIEGGVLGFDPDSVQGERADLITVEQFSDFELELEWAISEGGNSGIFFHVTEDHSSTWRTGPEVQVLDDDRHRDGKNPKTRAGSNYALHAPSMDVVREVGEFNRVRLRVQGDHVEHWLNGHKVVEYRLWTDEWKALVAASKFAAMPAYGLAKKGHIALQDHGDRVRYRSIKIREL